MIHTRNPSEAIAQAYDARWLSKSKGLPSLLVLSLTCWLPQAQAQSPVELMPPRATVQMLSPPRTNVVPIQQPPLVSVDPPSISTVNQPTDVTVLAPAIDAVRTQLEILSPPLPVAKPNVSGIASPTRTEVQSISAPTNQSTIASQSQFGPPQFVAGPTRPRTSVTIGPAQPAAPVSTPPAQFTSRNIPPKQTSGVVIETPRTDNTPPNAPTTRVATLTPPGTLARPSAAQSNSILELQPPASVVQQNAASTAPSSRPSTVLPTAPSTRTMNGGVSNSSNPTRIAQSPLSSTLPDNYRPLAPPAQPGPQPGASFSQEVGSNQVTIIPPPSLSTAPPPPTPPTFGSNQGSAVAGGGMQSPRTAPANPSLNQSANQPPAAQSTLPAMNPNGLGQNASGQNASLQNGPAMSGAAGIEVIHVDPNNFVPGVISDAIVSGNEPVWQFNFQSAPWSVVIRNFARQNGLALQMLSEPTGTFTFVDERPYPASEALDLLNDYLLSEGFLLVRNGNKLTTVAAGGPIQEGIVPFVPMRQIEILGRNELASVAIPIKSSDAAVVMNEVQSLLSRVGRAQIVSNSSRLVITDTGAYLRRARDIIGGYGLAAGDLQTVVVHLKNTTADNMASTISAHLGISLGASTGVVTAGGNGAGSVQTASFSSTTTMNTSSTRVIPDRETNSLVLSGTPAEVAEIQSLICQLDQARAQVILQGLILEVNLGNVNELGAEVGLQDSVLFNRSVIDNLVTLQNTNTAPNGVQTTNQNVVSQTSAPGFNFNGQPLGNNTAISPNVIGAQGLGNLGVGRTNSQLGFGGLVLSASSNSVSLLLRALQANFEVDVLSRPQIRTVDNKEAFIQIGQQVPVVDGVNVTAVGTANPIIRQDQAGIILKMTPNVSPDGLIQIKVSAEKSAFKLQPGTGVPIFTDARNGTVIQAPIKDITTAQATISARAGQTIVLGGMITRDEETIERRVPGLSRIPLIGRLFRYDYNNVTRKELLIFLTPHLIADDASSDAYKDSEIARTHAPLEHALQIHGPLYTNPPVTEEISE